MSDRNHLNFDFRSGYVAIAGTPNAGKSTLLNRMLGEKISITSKKPQTTRNRILGVLHRPEAQMVFFDTPGVFQAKDKLNTRIVDTAFSAVADADLILFMPGMTGNAWFDNTDLPRSEGGLIRAPTTVDMGRRIAETLSTRVETALYTLEGSRSCLIFQDTGRHAGLEAVGDLVRVTTASGKQGNYWRLAQIPEVEGALVALDPLDDLAPPAVGSGSRSYPLPSSSQTDGCGRLAWSRNAPLPVAASSWMTAGCPTTATSLPAPCR